MTAPTPATVSKAEFAALCNVDRSRVSHWIRDGRISGAALSGSGRSARIIVEVAQKQLRGNLDPYQMLPGGNGAKTRLDVPTPEPAGLPLSSDAEGIMAVLSEAPALVAWDVAEPGETTQRAFDAFMNLRLNLTGILRMRGFIVDDDAFEPVDWPGLAEEMGMTLVDPKRMAADWQRRRAAD